MPHSVIGPGSQVSGAHRIGYSGKKAAVLPWPIEGS